MEGHDQQPKSGRVARLTRPAALYVCALLALMVIACSRPAHRTEHEPLGPDTSTPNAGAAAPHVPGDVTVCENAGCIAPGPLPPGATCFEFVNHAPANPLSPYLVQSPEAVTCFYYDVPWTEPSGLIAWQTETETPAMREWALYTSAQKQPDGAVETCQGGADFRESQLLMAHPYGSNDVLMPPGVGLRLPDPGDKLVLQWHHQGSGGAALPDASVVRLCTLPGRALQRAAGLTVLGSESLVSPEGLPPGVPNVDSACTLAGDTPVRLMMLAPHMNRLGDHVRMSLQRASGGSQPILNVDFDYANQPMRATNVTMRKGDRVTTRCSYRNDTGTKIPFGGSFSAEQCYVFAIAEPAGALDNGAPSALGVTNTCWTY
jgi:hypothetical protein